MSLQEIRQIILDKKVELSDKTDGPLYILLDSIREALRQFLTFEQRLPKDGKTDRALTDPSFRRPMHSRKLYFAGLEMLRAHIHRTLLQVAKIAGMKGIPGLGGQMSYDGEHWELEAYKPPKELAE